MNKKAWLIDSSIYVFKAWFTREDIYDVNGNPINAVMGFMDFVYKLLSVEKPQLIGFAFDESLETSHRRDIYPEYKANRATAPESLRLQFRLCREFLRHLGILEKASPFYEADDLLGTWGQQFYTDLIPVNFITADKDLAQLVKEDDHWWEYLRGEMLDTKKITKRFGAKPSQIADQLAIAGDKSDNIPGVPGVGMSTAGKLLRKFETLENLLANISEISTMQIRGASRIQQLISDHQDTILLARRLTGIVCDIEAVKSKDFEISAMNNDAFGAFCDQLNVSEENQHRWLKLHHDLLQNADK
ncbi:5'-3' exonuclease [Cocleimonas sp. KMM 6892]|uniref:5'-3' exonuclease n=1 Tax=unclassified Cocleimonas TaxID=2639732 RepID=UPI002DBC99EF|nr:MULTISPECIES: 5'-3' exonuclease [unclassified Cocleimonas]MEB8431539.1 5'-3' exonuclease [Cocleimonas sp. KMM 6892]MEC4713689.1 5'-3' exonuclease [Cocleimonas sp. KMM 6895]MEC4743020.1 5'-3' exonuclease [Cocleimonas sp. KMM 6896]